MAEQIILSEREIDAAIMLNEIIHEIRVNNRKITDRYGWNFPAAYADADFISLDSKDDVDAILPKRFVYLGCGVSRMAILDTKTNLVFKIEKRENDGWQQNANEWSSWQRMRNLDHDEEVKNSPWRIPDMGFLEFVRESTIDTIIVMDNLGEECGGFPGYPPFEFSDMHPGNYRLYNGKYYPIDLGCNSRSNS